MLTNCKNDMPTEMTNPWRLRSQNCLKFEHGNKHKVKFAYKFHQRYRLLTVDIVVLGHMFGL